MGCVERMAVIIEIAVDSYEDALRAHRAGADRLELCSALETQGLSALPRLVAEIRRASAIPIAAMVRPRVGHFVPSPSDQFLAPRQAESLLAAGADGIVFGFVHPDGSVHRDMTRRMVAITGAATPVVHRSFDLAPDPLRAIDELVDLGVRRILTAGMSPAATAWAMGIAPTDASPPPPDSLETRLARLRSYVERARGRIEILPCGGVRAGNAARFLAETGAAQLHSAARSAGAPGVDAGQVASLTAAVRTFAPGA